MASNTSMYPDQQQQEQRPTNPISVDYVPNEEEKKVFQECNHESFWYRSVPLSIASMAVTQALLARGTLSVSPRFGPLPKLAFSGVFGYLVGKLSYMTVCQEKFKRLENSPLGEALRKRKGSGQFDQGPGSEMSHPDNQSFDPMFRTTAPSQVPSYSRDYDHGYSPEPATQMNREDDFSGQAKSYMEEEQPERKSILYENLRLKNRENYEVTLTQKAEATVKPSSEKERDRPKKEVKKNIYGDAWEE